MKSEHYYYNSIDHKDIRRQSPKNTWAIYVSGSLTYLIHRITIEVIGGLICDQAYREEGRGQREGGRVNRAPNLRGTLKSYEVIL